MTPDWFPMTTVWLPAASCFGNDPVLLIGLVISNILIAVAGVTILSVHFRAQVTLGDGWVPPPAVEKMIFLSTAFTFTYIVTNFFNVVILFAPTYVAQVFSYFVTAIVLSCHAFYCLVTYRRVRRKAK